MREKLRRDGNAQRMRKSKEERRERRRPENKTSELPIFHGSWQMIITNLIESTRQYLGKVRI